MSKADNIRERTKEARADLEARARRAADDEYSRSVMARIEMELTSGNYSATIVVSKAGAVMPSAYFARLTELAQADGFTVINENSEFVISWAEEA